MEKKIINLSSIFLYFVPFSFILGPIVSEGLILIASVLIIFLIFKNKDFYLFKKNFFYFFLIINIFLITSSVLAEFKSLSLKSTVPYFRWTLYLVTIYYLSIKKLSFIRNFSLSFLVCFILFFIDSSIQFTFGKNILGYETMVSNRISSFFKDELILGSFILKIVPIILFYLFLYNHEFKYKKLLLILICLTAFSMIFVSGERSSTYLFILYFLSFSIIFYKKIFREIKYVGFFIIFFLTIIYFFNDNYKGRMFDNFFNSLTNKIEHNQITKSKFKNFSIFSFIHEKHITSAYLMFRKGDLKTKLFGIGPKNFRNFCGDMKYCDYQNCCSTHPHNIPAQILSETGLIGIIILSSVYLILIKIIIMSLFHNIKYQINFKDSANIFLALGILIAIFPISTSGNFFHNKYSILLYSLVGIYYASLNKNLIPEKKINFFYQV